MRKLNNTWTWIVRILSFGLVAFQLYTTGSGPFSDIIQRSVHLAFVLTLLFILKPASKKIGEKEKEIIYTNFNEIFKTVSCPSVAMRLERNQHAMSRIGAAHRLKRSLHFMRMMSVIVH